MPLFAVIRTRGSRWRSERAPQEQEAYGAHAALIGQLYDEGVAVLGGWLTETGDVLLVMRAESAAEVKRRLAEDPWTTLDVLPVARVEEWSLALGTLGTTHTLDPHGPRQ